MFYLAAVSATDCRNRLPKSLSNVDGKAPPLTLTTAPAYQKVRASSGPGLRGVQHPGPGTSPEEVVLRFCETFDNQPVCM